MTKMVKTRSADNGGGGELIFEQVAVMSEDVPRVRITIVCRARDTSVEQRMSILVTAKTVAALLRDVTGPGDGQQKGLE